MPPPFYSSISGKSVFLFSTLLAAGVGAQNHDFCEEVREHAEHEIQPASGTTWLVAFAWAIVVWSMAFIGAAIPKSFILRHNHKLISLSIGSLLGTTFFELVPHTLDVFLQQKCLEGAESSLELKFGAIMLLGILFGFVVESVAHATSGGHAHGHGQCEKACKDQQIREIQLEECGMKTAGSDTLHHLHDCDAENPTGDKATACAHASSGEEAGESVAKPKLGFLESLKNLPTLAIVDIFAKLLHHFVDGAIIGLMCMIGLSDGSIIGINVTLHELSASLGGYAVHVALGVSKKLTIGLSVAKSITVPLGVIFALMGSAQGSVQVYLTPLAVGLFLYMTLADLVPILMYAPLGEDPATVKSAPTQSRRVWSAFVLFLFFAIGLGFTAYILLVHGHHTAGGHSHDHGDHHDHGHNH
eukprot:279009_1